MSPSSDGVIATIGKFAGTAAREIDAHRPCACARASSTSTPITIHRSAGISSRSSEHRAWRDDGGAGQLFALAGAREKGRPSRKLVKMFEKIEDIKEPTFDAAVSFAWESFGEYLDFIRPGLGIFNVGALVGHSALRFYVMGKESQERIATDDEIARTCVSCLNRRWRPARWGFRSPISIWTKTTPPCPEPPGRHAREDCTMQSDGKERPWHPSNRSLSHCLEPVAVDKDEERFRLFDAVSQLLIEISQRRPLVVVVDDLHWADRGTVAMLSHVAHFVPGNPILLIGAYRDAEVDRKHPLMGAVTAIRRLRNSESLQLKGLGSEEVTDLLGIIGDEKPPPELVSALTAETGGNPFSSARCSCICAKRARFSVRDRVGIFRPVAWNSG